MTIDKFLSCLPLKFRFAKNIFRIDAHYPFHSPQPYSYPNPPPADPNDLTGNPLQPPAVQNRVSRRVEPDYAITWFHLLPHWLQCLLIESNRLPFNLSQITNRQSPIANNQFAPRQKHLLFVIGDL
jgi:hypothetical protein